MPAILELPADLTINEVIHLWPGTVGIFNRFGIDACCGGAVTVRVAALRDGADPGALEAALLDAIRGARA